MTLPPAPARPRPALAPAEGASPLFVGSVAKCFRVLEALNTAGRAVGLTELAQMARLDRSAVQRITHTLRVLGYLRQDAASKAFRLSGRMLEFGHTVLATDQLRERAQPHLEALNRRTSETVNLMELEGDEIVYVARYPSVHAVSVDLHVGSRLPAFCTAAGRAILSRMEPADALARLKAARRTAMTPRTVTDLAGLRHALERAREQGYALNDQEAFIGDVSIAAALVDPHGHPLGAVNIAVPTPRWQLADVLARLVPPLLKTAAAITREVKYL
ncbi:IclR family transcriptional regulator [Piscinibacter koreensis]|uniref:IclR family transcriptional regulator n=1 Tax=Piscinibacter koreensis TaxID=2742824 RepID=A0A7Y6NNU6_9BURK|nr:IclR family transcriptional regulator [Schlegelella koreensis]NUZ06623.1 IclR family transcriptional regulator [Schlegelella koreensis]